MPLFVKAEQAVALEHEAFNASPIIERTPADAGSNAANPSPAAKDAAIKLEVARIKRFIQLSPLGASNENQAKISTQNKDALALL